MKNGLTKDEANNIAKTIEMMEQINQHTRIGTYCTKCCNIVCVCKIGENSNIHSELALKLPEYDTDDFIDDDGECDICGARKCSGSCFDDDF